MGLLKHLLSWPVTAPLALAEFSLRQVERVAETELTDDTAAREELMLLHMELEAGEIGLEEHGRREAELMQRLRDAREWRTKLGMEDEWAPLEVRRSREGDDGNGVAPGGAEADGGPQGP
jgi:hypothetical protein